MKRKLFLILFLLCLPNVLFAENAVSTGETLKYAIKKLRMKVGEAEFVFTGPAKKNDQDVLFLTFRSKGFQFNDEEKLFLDPATYRPLFVDRDINLFGKVEKISEVYAKDIGSVKITKTTKSGKEEQVISKSSPLENIYGFIYHYRQSGSFKTGERINLNLPTKNVVMRVKSNVQLKLNGKVYGAYYLESDGGEYKVWFSADDKKIPLRIEGAIGFGKTYLVYVPEK